MALVQLLCTARHIVLIVLSWWGRVSLPKNASQIHHLWSFSKNVCCKIRGREKLRLYYLQSRSDMKEQYNSVLSRWTMVCYNCIGSEWSQFSLNFWNLAQWPDLTTRYFLWLPVGEHGAFEDKRGRSTLPNLCASRKWCGLCRLVVYDFTWANKEPKRNVRYYIHLFVSWRWAMAGRMAESTVSRSNVVCYTCKSCETTKNIHQCSAGTW